MPNQTVEEQKASLQAQSEKINSRSTRLWIPGRRKYIACESYRLGFRWQELGEFEEAVNSFQRAIDAYDGQRPRKSKDSKAAFQVVAACYNHIGMIYLEANEFPAATKRFTEAIKLRRELKRLFPEDRENQVYLGGALCNIGLATKSTSYADAALYFKQSLAELRIPDQPCECSYWDEQRKSWWCEQLEAIGDALGLGWVFLAPVFIDNAQSALDDISGELGNDPGMEEEWCSLVIDRRSSGGGLDVLMPRYSTSS